MYQNYIQVNKVNINIFVRISDGSGLNFGDMGSVYQFYTFSTTYILIKGTKINEL